MTTPESLSLMLTRERAAAELAGVHTVIVDEWHELVGSKRGVQVQLALARLRRWNPGLAVWGLSATLGQLDQAMATLVAGPHGRLVQGRIEKNLVIDTLLPADPGRFSWGGHLGAQMVQPVVQELEPSGTTLVFTNVRSQAEIWYQLLLQERPAWAGRLAVHHGSLDASVRAWVEAGLKAGELKAVVATSSLDLQHALHGQEVHASRVTLVPTHTLELVEAAAARRAVQAGRVESRAAPDKPLDVLVQHLVTVALGGGFEARPLPEGGFDAPDMRAEVRTAPAYASLTDEEFDWALRFCERGGQSLGAYPDFHRIAVVDGRWCVPDRGIARRHRLQVGTIVADASLQVKWLTGGTLGHIEEGFIARLKPGDHFVFAGRVLEFVRVREMAAYVRKATRRQGVVPAWGGSKMPLSGTLADAVRDLVQEAALVLQPGVPQRALPATTLRRATRSSREDSRGASEVALDGATGVFAEPEMRAALPMLRAQARLSRLPLPGELLVERWRSREGWHVFVYPFAGRNVHMGLAQLLAWRLAQAQPNSFSLSVNDYGLELLAAREPVLDDWPALLRTEGLAADVLGSLNTGELAQRRFREIARVAGLVFNGYPGAPKSLKQLQASSGLFFQVFRQYDPLNRLLTQAEQEVLAQELDLHRLADVLHHMAQQRLQGVWLNTVSPFSLPLVVERFREQLSTEKLQDRLDRILAQAEAALDRT